MRDASEDADLALIGFCAFEEESGEYFTKSQIQEYVAGLSQSFARVWVVGNVLPRSGKLNSKLKDPNSRPIPHIHHQSNIAASSIAGTIRTLRKIDRPVYTIMNLPAPGYIPLIVPLSALSEHFSVYIARDPSNAVVTKNGGALARRASWLKQRVMTTHTLLALHLSDSTIVRGDPSKYESYGPVFESRPIISVPDADAVTASDKLELLYVGGLYERKSVDILLETTARLIDAGHELSLRVVGDGNERDRLEGLAEKLAISDSVEFEGYIDDPDILAQIYTGSNLLVHPSEYGEGFPRVIDEAQIYGLPVVTTKLPQYGDLLTDGENVLFADPGSVDSLTDTIATAIDDPELRQRLADAGRERASDLVDETAAEQHARIVLERE